MECKCPPDVEQTHEAEYEIEAMPIMRRLPCDLRNSNSERVNLEVKSLRRSD